ncbi:hypothetical protein [Mucilaginibacter myungsuensis]|uniref:von Willebrand factor type A domain-containing protein n=1 Tax=Mucilaginibacter myungsuensis TaxID=649104 RepID=A0A929KZA3_9SPHI|nr:hypothetical protein [Mucilaginibacter myungsuensis]MBE9662693.1 hypothetical protein [Mucilaginibacter myungsuensis]MDN3598113.1 hypothetical protein [Mucilaginibacter myungsuensis]
MKIKLIIILLLNLIILSSLKCRKDTTPEPVPDKTVEGLFLGVVGFNSTVYPKAMNNNITATYSAIDGLLNTVDQTALCYGVKTAIEQLKTLNSTQTLDQAFIVSFTDGLDNVSANFFTNVGQGAVIPYTADLLRNTSISNKPIKSYTIGFKGNGAVIDADLSYLAVNGQYLQANSSNINSIFQSIAQSLIATSQNISIVTNNVEIFASSPKYFRITFNTYSTPEFTGASTPFTIFAQMTNIDKKSPVFKVTSAKSSSVKFIGDDGTPISGTISTIISGGKPVEKATIPLENLSITSSNGQNLFVKDLSLSYKYNQNDYETDIEDTKGVKSIAKNVGVVLVLDCSTSLGNQFVPMKESSKKFIETLVNSVK